MKKLNFVLSLITQDHDYPIEQAASAEEIARRLGLDLKIVFADNDAIQQSQPILEFIQTKSAAPPDGIILEPAGGAALPQAARAAETAGIGWVVLSCHADHLQELRKLNGVPIFALNSDSVEVAACLPNGGTALYLQGPSDSATAKQRTDGLHAIKPANIQPKMMKAQWTEASAYKAITAWLRLSTSQQSRIDLIAAQNDAMAVGARKAFQEVFDQEARDRWLAPPYIGSLDEAVGMKPHIQVAQRPHRKALDVSPGKKAGRRASPFRDDTCSRAYSVQVHSGCRLGLPPLCE